MKSEWNRKNALEEANRSQANRRLIAQGSCSCGLEMLEPRLLLSVSPFIVTSAADTNVLGTLRYAISQANAHPGSHDITFNISGTDIIHLSNGELLISDPSGAVTINGVNLNDGGNIAIDGGSLSRVFEIHSNVRVSISNLTIENGLVTGGSALGGGMLLGANAKVVLTNVQLLDNAVVGAAGSDGGNGSDGKGGGIYMTSGTLTIAGGDFDGNTATGGVGGNGVSSSAIFAGGSGGNALGGGIYVAAGVLKMTNVNASTNGVTSGVGGDGAFSSSGVGGNGGDGGIAAGAAVYVNSGTVILAGNGTLGNFAANTATAQSGGAGHAAQTGFGKTGGDGGHGGLAGGTIFLLNGNATVTDMIIENNTIIAGSGGNAGAGDGVGAGGEGGTGGHAFGVGIAAPNATVTVSGGSIQDNVATAGNGGSGAIGQPGGSGGDGGSALGGGVFFNTGNLTLNPDAAQRGVAVNGNSLIAGNGGSGGHGVGAGSGGNGGHGGTAVGGGICSGSGRLSKAISEVSGMIAISQTGGLVTVIGGTVNSNSVTAGNGSDGGSGAIGGDGGTGGDALGGGISSNGGVVNIAAITISGGADVNFNSAIAGDGADGGISLSSDETGGSGGSGGATFGGGIFYAWFGAAGPTSPTILYSGGAVSHNVAAAGDGGAGGQGGPTGSGIGGEGGSGGNGGLAGGGGIYSSAGRISMNAAAMDSNAITAGDGYTGGTAGGIAEGGSGGNGGGADGGAIAVGNNALAFSDGAVWSSVVVTNAVVTNSVVSAGSGGDSGAGGLGSGGSGGSGGNANGGGVFLANGTLTFSGSIGGSGSGNTARGGNGGASGSDGGTGGAGGSANGGGLYAYTGFVTFNGNGLIDYNEVVGGNSGNGSGAPTGGAGSGGGVYLDTASFAGGFTGETSNSVAIADNIAEGGSGSSDGGDGASSGGGIYVANGAVTLDNATISSNKAQGQVGGDDYAAGTVAGGGIYSIGSTVTLAATNVGANEALGGAGGVGTNARIDGGAGGTAQGGGVFLGEGSSLVVIGGQFDGNRAHGGAGGAGAAPASDGVGGAGGAGGNGEGGGVYSSNASLTLYGTAVTGDAAIGGNGGNGGDAFAADSAPYDGGAGGAGGAGIGGGIYINSTGGSAAVNVTYGANSDVNGAAGGMGGAGGTGINGGSSGTTGSNGAGNQTNISNNVNGNGVTAESLFGTVLTKSNSSMSFTNSVGKTTTVKLGAADPATTVYVLRTDMDASAGTPDIRAIVAVGADPQIRNSLTITTAGGGSDTVGSIAMIGNMGVLKAHTTSLTGDGAMVVSGAVRDVILQNVQGGVQSIWAGWSGGPAPANGFETDWTFNNTTDVNLRSWTCIRHFKANSVSQDAIAPIIVAPEIDSLRVAGAFNTDLWLFDASESASRVSATVGSLDGCTWEVAGSIAAVQVTGAGAEAGNTITNETINTTRNMGNWTVYDAVSGAIDGLTMNASGGGKMTILGQVNASGGIGLKVNAAGNIGNVYVTGAATDVRLSSDVGGVGNLTFMSNVTSLQVAAADSIGNITIKGDAANLNVRAPGNIGNIQLRSAANVDVLAGIDPSVALRAKGVDDFVNKSAAIASLTITGPKTAHNLFANSNFSAARMGPIVIVNAEYGNGGTPFGLWGLYGSGGIRSVRIVDGFIQADNTVIAHKAKQTPPVTTVFPTGTNLTVKEF